jgi:hypothetical protein
VERWQVKLLITCRLNIVDGWPDGEGEGMVGPPGGHPESAHRLRFPMVKVPMGSVGYVGTSTYVCRREPGLLEFTNTELYLSTYPCT